jgi:uncharacterized protein YecE (DUF72 family)
LGGLAASIRDLSGAVQQVHVVFNNNFGNYAQRNAAELGGLLNK